jgi:hypothetical protein
VKSVSFTLLLLWSYIRVMRQKTCWWMYCLLNCSGYTQLSTQQTPKQRNEKKKHEVCYKWNPYLNLFPPHRIWLAISLWLCAVIKQWHVLFGVYNVKIRASEPCLCKWDLECCESSSLFYGQARNACLCSCLGNKTWDRFLRAELVICPMWRRVRTPPL